MIKNILQSKLYVLCSMLFCSLVVSVFCFGTSSKAANNYDNLVSDLSSVGFHFANNVVKNYWESNPNKNIYVSYTTNNAYIYFGDDLTYTEGNPDILVNYDEYGYNLYKSDGIADWTHFNTFSQVGKAFLCYYVGLGGIDWDNPFYAANIVAPDISVTYRNLSSTPVVDVPLNIGIESYPNAENEYFVQLFGLINYDENYYVQNSRDGLIYNGMDLQKYTTYVDIVTPQEMIKPSDLSYDMIHLRFTDGWYNHFPPDSLFSFTFQEGIPVPLQTSAINKFNSFRKNATFADNTVYVYARYFVIDENDNFVVGPWRIWKSYNPNEFTTEIPTYYLPYSVVPGTVGTNENVDPVSTSSPEPSVIINPVNTNPNVNVTVTQNVPNYPDYPTIASYNKDNLLVDTINSLNSFTQFFGDFGLFLTAAFGFIPEWIWGIIGVGFSLSIIVMFLKIL